jgi:hypothetical protein
MINEMMSSNNSERRSRSPVEVDLQYRQLPGGTEEATKHSDRTAGVSAEIRTECLPHTARQVCSVSTTNNISI